MTSLESLVKIYGYPILLAGAFFEGETIVIIAGFLAHRGYLELHWVVLIAFLGTYVADQMYFYLGRTKGNMFIQKRPSWQPRIQKVKTLLDRYRLLVIIGFRFLYGLRTVTPFAIGMSGFNPRQFAVLNAISAMVWAIIISSLGCLFGRFIENRIAEIEKYELLVLFGVVVIGGGVWSVYLIRQSYRRWLNKGRTY